MTYYKQVPVAERLPDSDKNADRNYSIDVFAVDSKGKKHSGFFSLKSHRFYNRESERVLCITHWLESVEGVVVSEEQMQQINNAELDKAFSGHYHWGAGMMKDMIIKMLTQK